MENQTIDEWFNPKNIEHLKAFRHLQDFGTFPDNFLPNHIIVTHNWYINVLIGMAECWLYSNIEGAEKSTGQ